MEYNIENKDEQILKNYNLLKDELLVLAEQVKKISKETLSNNQDWNNSKEIMELRGEMLKELELNFEIETTETLVENYFKILFEMGEKIKEQKRKEENETININPLFQEAIKLFNSKLEELEKYASQNDFKLPWQLRYSAERGQEGKVNRFFIFETKLIILYSNFFFFC